MIILLYILPLFFMVMVKGSDDMHIDMIPEIIEISGNDDISESIINGFFHEHEEGLRAKIKPILMNRIERESSDTKMLLLRFSHIHTPLAQTEHDPIGAKALELMTAALKEVIEDGEREKRSRCTRFTTVALSTGLALACTTIGAIVSAVVTESVTNNC
jgi:hypothetical protein